MHRAAKICIILLLVALFGSELVAAQDAAQPQGSEGIIRTALMLTVLALIPALFISMTSFIRIAVVLAMVRHAFGMPETPPNPVLIALAFFLSIFVMAPTLQDLNEQAFQPYMSGSMTIEEVAEAAQNPMRDFMLSQVRDQDLRLMYEMSGKIPPATPQEVDLLVLTPAFILNELRIAFTIGFIVMLPFLLIDLVVSSILLSLGMMMVPPVTISLPIKLLMFVVIDGWSLVIQGVLGGFG